MKNIYFFVVFSVKFYAYNRSNPYERDPSEHAKNRAEFIQRDVYCVEKKTSDNRRPLSRPPDELFYPVLKQKIEELITKGFIAEWIERANKTNDGKR